MSHLSYHLIPVTAFAQNCTLLICNATQSSALIDPGGDAERIIAKLSVLGLIPQQILLTHGHLDHVGAAKQLADYYQIKIIGPDNRDKFLFDALPQQSEMFGFPPCEVFYPDEWLTEGQSIAIGQQRFAVLHCPGHTPGHIVFYNSADQLLISGDVIFRGGVGRSDFARGNHYDLIASIKEKLLPLGGEVTFIPGHGDISTLGYEKVHNPFLR